MSLTGDWKKAFGIVAGASQEIRQAAKIALVQEGQELRKQMIQQFQDGHPLGGTWVKLSPVTLAVRALKGFTGTKILVKSASLRNSIQAIPIEDGVFIGITRSAPRSDGKDPVDVAKLHEFGGSWKIQMTPKQYRFLFAAMAKAGIEKRAGNRGSPSGPHTITITIPPRPFIQPILDNVDPARLQASLENRMAKLLKGKLSG